MFAGMMRSLLKFGFGCWLLVTGLSAQTPADALVAKDLVNEKHALASLAESGPVLLVFVSPYCPTSNRFMSEINAITKSYEGKVKSFLVHADVEVKRDDVLQHTELNEVKVPVLLDEEQLLLKQFQVTTSPEVVVLGKGARVVYQGRINDLYLTPTKRQRQATVHDLRTALDEVLAGKAVSNPRTQAVGCEITKR